MLNRILLFLILIISFSNCKSVINRKDKVTQQLESLQSGALLVRLPTNEAKVAKLKKIGKPREAKKEAAFMKQFHIQILSGFDNHFTFCPVYFYFSKNSKEIKKGNFEKLLFDADRKEVKGLNLSDENVLYGEFGKVHDVEVTSEKKGENVKVAGFGGTNAFVIRDKQGLQPDRPFPYSVKYDAGAYRFSKKSVANLNRSLFRVYARMEKRKIRRGR